jgi:paraquat-inducible protein B
VDVGEVKAINLSEDLTGVVVTAELVKEAERHLVEDTRFWVVRARIGSGGVSGLGTLFAGSYIGVDVGQSATSRREFTGLEVPPVPTSHQPGRQFVLRGHDLGSLDQGDAVFFRRVQVGQITSAGLDKDGTGVTVNIFINAPYDRFVTTNTRFWHASGIDVSLDATGIKVDTQSLATVMLGGIAFEMPPDAPVSAAADADTVFTIFADRGRAMKRPDVAVQRWVYVFDESLRGLEPGAPVDLRGVLLGEVKEIGIQYNPVKKDFGMRVEALIYRERLRAVMKEVPSEFEDRTTIVNTLVEQGFRAQLRTGNLLTGQLYVALDFFPTAPRATVDWTKDPPELPTVPGGLKELQETFTRFASKLDKVPLDQIGLDLQRTLNTLQVTLHSVDRLVKRLDAEVAPEVRAALAEARRTLGTAERTLNPEAPLQQDLRDALHEIARAAQSLRVLTDYLERHPEAVIRGKKEDER